MNSYKKMICLGISTLLLVPFLIESSKADESEKMEKLKKLESDLTIEKNFYFLVDGQKKEMEQQVSVKDCKLTLKTIDPVYGLIYRDVADLTTLSPHRKWKLYNGAYGLFFGVKSAIKGRSKLFFNSKTDLQTNYKAFNDLSKSCKDKEVKNYLVKNKESVPNHTTYVGMLPQGKHSTDGLIKTEKNTMASLNGKNCLIQRVKSAMAAKKSIYVQSLIYRADDLGRFITDLLIKRHQDGIDVKVIVDFFGSGIGDLVQSKVDKKNAEVMLNNLMAAGIRVFGYSCKKRAKNEVYGADFTKLLRRNHEKMWIVDGDLNGSSDASMAIMGGVNLAQEYFSLAGGNIRTWRDHDVGLRGPIVKDLYDSFNRIWIDKEIRYRTYQFDNECYNPYNPILQKEMYTNYMEEKTKAYAPYELDEDLKYSSLVKENIQKVLNNDANWPKIYLDQGIEFRKLDGVRFVHARPEEGENYSHEAYIDLINRATKSIDIAAAYFVPTDDFTKAMQNAVKRGVKIRVYSNSIESNALPMMTILGRAKYDLIYSFAKGEENVIQPEFFEWSGKYKNEGEILVKTIHSKYMIVDGKAGLIGSHNLNHSSMNNGETVVLFDSEELAQDLLKQFEFDLLYTRKLSPKEIKDFANPENIKDKGKLKMFKLIENFV